MDTGNGPGAAFTRHHLNTLQGNVEYHYGTKLSGTVGLFGVNGTPDPILYPQVAVTGSANGDPRSNGYILNLSWWPQQNIDLAVQYTGYWRFNGLQTNYDGAGRNASDNNTVYLLATICLLGCGPINTYRQISNTIRWISWTRSSIKGTIHDTRVHVNSGLTGRN